MLRAFFLLLAFFPGVAVAQESGAATKALAKIKEFGRVDDVGTKASPLFKLNLGRSRITDADMIHLKGITTPFILDLTGTAVGDDGLKHLEGLSHAHGIFLGETKVTDAGLASLKKCPNLVAIKLVDLTVTTAGIEHLAGCLKLEVLLLGGEKGAFTDDSLKPLVDFKKLRILTVETSRLTKAALPHIAKVTGLEQLALSGATNGELIRAEIGDADLASLAPLTKLNLLNLIGLKINGRGLEALKESVKLQQLSMAYCETTDDGLKSLRHFPGLLRLVLDGHLSLGKTVPTAITDAGLDHLAALKYLQVLDVSQSNITDAGLAKLGNLTTLLQISLDGCAVTDAGLPALKKLNALQAVKLRDTKVTPAGIDELKKSLPKLFAMQGSLLTDLVNAELRKVEGVGGSIDATDPKRPVFRVRSSGETHPTDAELATIRSVLEKIPMPVALNLSYGKSFTAAGTAHLNGLKNLDSINLNNVPVTDDFLPHLAKLPALRVLYLSGTKVTDAGLVHLANLKSLEDLSIGGDASSDISDAGLAHLKGLTNLRELSIYSKAITPAGYAHVAAMTKLRKLILGSSHALGDFELSSIKALVQLEDVRVGGENMTDAGMADLARLKGLRILEVGGEKLTAAGLKHLGALADLEKLKFFRSAGLVGDGLAPLAGLKKLTYLHIYESGRIQLDTAQHIGALKGLKYLRMNDVHSEALPGIAGLKSLEDLDLSYAYIDDKGLKSLAGLTGLKKLDLASAAITDAGLAHLKDLKKLENLELYKCSKLTDAASELAKGLPALKYVNFGDTKVTPKGIEGLRAARPKLLVN